MNDVSQKYRILFEASKLYQSGQDGVKRYTEELLKELFLQTKNDDFLQVDLLLGKHIVPIEHYFTKEFGIIEKKRSAIANDMELFKEGIIMNILYFYFKLPFCYFKQQAFNFYYDRFYSVMLTMLTRIGKGKYEKLRKEIETYDLIHVSLPQNMLFFKKIDARFVTTLHDISHRIFPKFHTKDNIKRSEAGLQLSMNKNAHFIAVSTSTKNDMISSYSIHENDIKTILEGVDSNVFFPRKENDNFNNVNQLFNLENKNYFLSIGTLEPRKNLIKTIHAFLALEQEKDEEIYLVIVGGKGWKNRKIKKELNINSDKVIFLGFVPGIHLRAIYIQAICLIYASFYEGFGLPLLESMTCGTPVVYGNNSSMPEVVSKGGIGINSNDINSIKEGMNEMINPSKREVYARNSLERANSLPWHKMASKTIHYYQEILN